MAGTSFHSLYGFSIGIPQYITIDANGNVSANYANFMSLTSSVSNIGIATANSMTVTGNLTVTGNISGNLTGKLQSPGADTWVLYTIGGNASASANYTFNPATNFLHVSNGNMCVDNNITANYLYGDGSNVTNVAAKTAVNVTASAQPNITSLTNLVNLTVTANGTANLGNIANLKIAGGTTGQTIITTSTGALAWGYTPKIANGTSNISIDTFSGPITFGANGVANIITVNGPNATNNRANVIYNSEIWANGNIRANYFDGDGGRLSNINASNIVGNMSYSGSFLIIGRSTNKTIVMDRGQFGLLKRSGMVTITA